MDEGNADGQMTVPPPTEPIGEKRGGFFGFLKRKNNSPAVSLNESSTKESTQEPEVDVSQDQQTNLEVAKNPETLKRDLRESLVKLVDLQNEVYFKTRALPKDTSSEAYLEAKTSLEKTQQDAHELNAQLLEGLDSARDTLGHFSKVIKDQEGNKAVILRTPLTREVTQTIYAKDPANTPRYESNEAYYKQHSEIQDVFVVNKAGVYRQSVENPQAHTLESVGNSKIDEPYREQRGEKTFRGTQQEDEKRALEYRWREWYDNIKIAFSEEPTKDNDHVFNDFTAGSWAWNATEGQQQYEHGLAESIDRKYGIWGPDQSIAKVSTSVDVAAAFDASVEDAKGTVGRPEPNWLQLFDSKPNPVSAEPMTKEEWSPEPVNP